MKIFEKAKSPFPQRGQWTERYTHGGTRTACVCCPECGELGTLENHSILGDGTVTPSVICAVPDCDFHDFARLADWPPVQ